MRFSAVKTVRRESFDLEAHLPADLTLEAL